MIDLRPAKSFFGSLEPQDVALLQKSCNIADG